MYIYQNLSALSTWGELHSEKDCEPAWLQIGRDGH